MKIFSKMIVATAVLGMFASFSVAKPKPVTCPACGMTLSKHKDKNHTVAVKTKNGTFYCCAACKMNKGSKGKSKK